MASPSVLQGPLIVHSKQRTASAATVEYDDDFEKANASLQVAWSTVMDQSTYYGSSSIYKRVKCLLISWDKSCDDLHTDAEVSDLAGVLENTFRYKVIRKLLNSKTEKLPHQQLMKFIADFSYYEDAPRTLLLVYYAGHGSPKSSDDGRHGLTLTGQRRLSEDPKEASEIVWESIERNLSQTKGDVLEIFDCCYAGDLGRDGQTWSRRSFEFLGACSSGNTTPAPGPKSFTRALIWALKSLAQQEKRFTVSGLSRKIREAPNFPQVQVPVQLDRGPGSIERIMLAPLPEPIDGTESASNEIEVTEPQGLLNLNFIFNKPPTKDVITNFGENLNKFIIREKMPVNRIVWGGLTSWEGSEPSPGANSQKLVAAKRFKDGLRRRSERKQREAEQANIPRLQTPLSSVERATLSPTPPSDFSQSPTKKRKLSGT